jgi:prolyl-tRNA synthetase
MLASQFLISTLKEAPSDAEITSHQLMMRAGLIKRLGSGIYTYMPMGLRVIRKVEAIIRQEMNAADALEVTMPMIQPAELWQETNRFEKMGAELVRIKDRHDRDFVIQPTSEEVVTDIARQDLRSYKQLPKNLYQIQTKFRDERRPRFGIMRGREFTMKDAYSFDKDAAGATESYQKMFAAYQRIFNRFGLHYRAVAADTGAIGGDLSHEFQVIAATGEDAIVYCPTSDYAANIELAEAVAPTTPRAAPTLGLVKTPTPAKKACQEVADFLQMPLQKLLKSLVIATDIQNEQDQPIKTQFWLVLIRADHELNEIKLSKIKGLEQGFRFATTAEIQEQFDCPPGYLGPVGLPLDIKVLADRSVPYMSDFVCGANESEFHLCGVNWGRDLPEPTEVADIRNVLAGEPSPDGQGILAIQRGIEVGHVFYLGTKYSKAMNATFLDANGKPQFFEMGCYGIGVTRILGAAIEQSHDERGIIWPKSIAPFEVVICPIGMDRQPKVKAAAEQLYTELQDLGMDVILDDRGERPGAMFADWELIGVPLRVVLSDRSLNNATGEIQGRLDSQAASVPLEEIVSVIQTRLRT